MHRELLGGLNPPALTSHTDVQRSPLCTCSAERQLLRHSALQSCTHTGGGGYSEVTHGQHAALWLYTQDEGLTYWREGTGGRRRGGRCVFHPGWAPAWSHPHTSHRNLLCCDPCSSEERTLLWKWSWMQWCGQIHHVGKLTLQTPVMSSQESAWPLQLHGKHWFPSLRKNPFLHWKVEGTGIFYKVFKILWAGLLLPE